MKGYVVVWIILLGIVLISAFAMIITKPKNQESIEEVRLENRSGYVIQKIYITDSLGWTHEILTASSGSRGGVEMLELCKWKN